MELDLQCECEICGALPESLEYDGMGPGALPAEAHRLRDPRGREPDPGRDGNTVLTCPVCAGRYRLVVDVGFGEWYVTLNRVPTES